MATTFTQAKSTLDEIAARSEASRKRIAQAKALVAAALVDLTGMAATYAAFITDLNAAAAAAPSDAAWTAALAEKNQMVTDFQALKTEAASLNAAVGN